MKKDYSVIIPDNVFPKPSRAELSAAYILCEHFKNNVKFIPRNSLKTPDLLIGKTEWELKSPTGNGKRNLQHTIGRALKQSKCIIIDARFSKLHISKIKNKLADEFSKNRQIKRLLLIDKQKNVIEFFK